MLLKFKPANMDVLPLYIVLLGGFPPTLWLLKRAPMLGLAASLTLYAAAWILGWNLPAYPKGTWAFNPFTWQLLFVAGAWCALGGAARIAPLARSQAMLWLAAGYLAVALAITLVWRLPHMGSYLAGYLPHRLTDWINPADKTNLDVLRFAHFVALAILTLRYIPRDWPHLASPWLRPAILCGQHSLEIFCSGVFLAFAAHFAMVELSDGLGMQILVSVVGIATMVAVAALITWYRNVEGKKHGPRQTPVVNADLAGGEA
jgi:hypothetical protein